MPNCTVQVHVSREMMCIQSLCFNLQIFFKDRSFSNLQIYELALGYLKFGKPVKMKCVGVNLPPKSVLSQDIKQDWTGHSRAPLTLTPPGRALALEELKMKEQNSDTCCTKSESNSSSHRFSSSASFFHSVGG